MLKYIPYMAVVVLLSACAKTQYVERQEAYVPYTFQVEEFIDVRQEDTRFLSDMLKTREVYPFEEQRFLKSLVSGVNHKAYVADVATMRVSLLDYASIVDGTKHTLSFYVQITGVDPERNHLGTGRYSCLQEGRQSFDVLTDTVKDAFSGKELSIAKNKAKLWHKMYDDCMKDIANQFKVDVQERIRIKG